MIITLTVLALLIQFAGLYALLSSTQQAQKVAAETPPPASQRGHQAYYNAFAEQQAKARRERLQG